LATRAQEPNRRSAATGGVLGVSGSACNRVDEALAVVHRDRQSGMVLEADHPLHPIVEMDADASIVIGAEGEAIVDEGQAGADRGVPAVALGDVTTADVRHRCLERQSTVGGQETTVVGEGDAVLALTRSKWPPQQLEAVVKAIGEELVRHTSTMTCLATAVTSNMRAPDRRLEVGDDVSENAYCWMRPTASLDRRFCAASLGMPVRWGS
jgi:hypothetical protein